MFLIACQNTLVQRCISRKKQGFVGKYQKRRRNLNEKQEDAYKVTMRFTYIKDLGYDKEGTLYLIKNNNKLEVVSYNPSITSE